MAGAGVFTEVSEGNRLQRAAIGFGHGQTDLQVVVDVADRSRGTPEPMYEVETSAQSGHAPGAVITLNPYVAAARFVLAGHDLNRNVKKTADQIAGNVSQRIETNRH